MTVAEQLRYCML